ncbi:MAG: CoA pyrophosphatase [Burkholderiales bacterium]|jgi:8-oxo-dGTP pyrophosphatase MutT (NUDIX family)
MIEASVLVPVYRGAGGELRLILIRRSDNGIHGGHLAFPGGKRDPCDRSMLDTALREAREEIGIREDQIEILTELPLAETRTTGFRVHPFLGRIVQQVAWQRNAHEVAEIMDLSLAELIDAEVLNEDDGLQADASAPRRAPYYRVGDDQLWGLTFRILRGVIPRLQAGEWKI